MRNLKIYAFDVITKYPDLKEEVLDFVDMCFSEIDSGESKDNELELCYSSIKDLIKERHSE